MDIKHKMKNECGQASVELSFLIPVVLVVVVIAVNASVFISECAAFDRVSRNAIRACAASPVSGESAGQVAARVQASLSNAFNKGYENVIVTAAENGGGYTTYTAQLEFRPTLFGKGLVGSVFGINLPVARHLSSLTVDTYRVGEL